MKDVEAEVADVAWIGIIQYVIWKGKSPTLSCVVEFVWYLYLNPYANSEHRWTRAFKVVN